MNPSLVWRVCAEGGLTPSIIQLLQTTLWTQSPHVNALTSVKTWPSSSSLFLNLVWTPGVRWVSRIWVWRRSRHTRPMILMIHTGDHATLLGLYALQGICSWRLVAVVMVHCLISSLIFSVNQKRKQLDEHVQYGFACITDGSQHPTCRTCNAKFSNSSTAPTKLKEHYLKLHGDGELTVRNKACWIQG